MKVSDALTSRRAVKGFDPGYPIPDQTLKDLLSQAMRSPTAFNIQHWRFVWVKAPALRAEIRKVAWDQAQVTDASALLVMAADLKAWESGPRYWAQAPQPVQDFLVPAIDAYYRDKPQVERDECMRSLGLVSMSIMLLAREHGYDSCPMDGFDFEAVARLVNLPPTHVIGLMIAIGRKTKEPWPPIGKIGLDEALVVDRFA